MRAYSGRATIKQLPYLKPGYKGKNMSDGRQTYFRQSTEYKRHCKRLEHKTVADVLLALWQTWEAQ